MPDLTVAAPAAVMPADRLTLGAADARADLQPSSASCLGCTCNPFACMAEE